jgi:hypothetical protein
MGIHLEEYSGVLVTVENREDISVLMVFVVASASEI